MLIPSTAKPCSFLYGWGFRTSSPKYDELEKRLVTAKEFYHSYEHTLLLLSFNCWSLRGSVVQLQCRELHKCRLVGSLRRMWISTAYASRTTGRWAGLVFPQEEPGDGFVGSMWSSSSDSDPIDALDSPSSSWESKIVPWNSKVLRALGVPSCKS